MSVNDFDQRRNKVLELIIEAYVTTASPVGSELIARRLRSTLSSATIRNTMVQLEEQGYLVQPHTSAGRVPTDQGYRFYVDAVMESPHWTREQLRQLAAQILPAEPDVMQLLERASAVLSELTQQAAVAVAPTVKQSTVKQIELVPLSVRKILCVLVGQEEMVASHVVEITEPMTRDEAVALARFLNTELAGLSFVELLHSLERRMLAESDSFYHVVKRSLAILQHALSTEPDERLLLQGASYVVSQPEFSRDPRKMHELLKSLDAEAELLEHIRQHIAADGVRVRIGHEMQLPGLEECSLITAPCAIGDDPIGGIGILGPKRMPYARLRPLVEAMGQCVTDVLTGWDEGN